MPPSMPPPAGAGAAVPEAPRPAGRRADSARCLQHLECRLAVDHLLVHPRPASREQRAPLAGVIGPSCEAGGSTQARSVMPGVPLASSSDTSASPTPSSRIAFARCRASGWAHRLGHRLHRLLVARREGAQRVLHAVAELAQHLLGNVERVLGDEVDADALGADQPHHLLDLLEQRRRRVVEQQVRLVEEEHQLRLVAVADLGQVLEQLGQQPQQEARVQRGLFISLSAARMLTTPGRPSSASGPRCRASARRRSGRRPAPRAAAGRAGSRRSTPATRCRTAS
jgi:hypothetical protein